jgi:hypothetical protein
MDKWEQQLKNDVNSSLPSNVDQRIGETLQHLPRKKCRPKIYYGLSAAIVAVSFTFGLTFLSPSFAETVKNLPVVGSAFEFVGDIGVKKGKQEGLTIELGEQIEVDGQLITFTETLYDGGEIHIGYIIETNNTDYRVEFLSNLEFLINGRFLGSYGWGGHEEEVEDGIFAGTFSIHIRDDIPDSFLLGIRPREGGSWVVELPVEMQGDYKAFLVNETKELDDLAIHYNKVTFFPTSTELDFRLIIDEDVYFDDKYMMLDYQVTDDLGRVLQPFSGGGGGGGPENGKVIHDYKNYFEPLDPIPSSITIKPYLYDMQTTVPELIRQKWEGTKLTMSQGDIGQITILNITREDGTITITCEVEGENLYQQANAIWIQDSDGNRHDRDEPAVRLDGTINQYQMTFSTSLDEEDLYVTTVNMSGLNFLEELEVTFELD